MLQEPALQKARRHRKASELVFWAMAGLNTGLLLLVSWQAHRITSAKHLQLFYGFLAFYLSYQLIDVIRAHLLVYFLENDM